MEECVKRDSITLRLLVWIIVIFVLTGGIHSQSPLAFCDLIRSPQKYNGKEVTVRATYRYGFEWSELYCLDCLDQGKAWLDMPTVLEDTSAKSLKKLPKGAGIVNLTVQGIFVSGSTFGHSNAYRYKIEPSKISDVVVLQKGMKSPEEEKSVERRSACGGTNPK
jgi:hypothetical protein